MALVFLITLRLILATMSEVCRADSFGPSPSLGKGENKMENKRAWVVFAAPQSVALSIFKCHYL